MSPMIYYEEGEGEGEGESNSSSSNRSWCNLTPDLVIEIANKVPPLEYLLLRSSCSIWSSLIPSEPLPVPWLFLSEFSSFYCLVDQHHRFFSFSLPLPFPLTGETSLPGMLCNSCQDGFLILLDERNNRVVLFNPLTGATIELPTSTVHSCGDFLRDWMFAFSHNTVVAFNACDTTIITYKGITRTIDGYYIRDVVFHEGKLYGIEDDGRLLCFDINNVGKPEIVAWMQARWSERYLVSLGGDILMVEARLRFSCAKLKGFFVWRFCPGRSRWLRVRDLDGWSLFISRYNCVALCVKDVPQLRANCIYYSDTAKKNDGPFEIIVFDMRERRKEFWNRLVSWNVWQQPLWFIPSATNKITSQDFEIGGTR